MALRTCDCERWRCCDAATEVDNGCRVELRSKCAAERSIRMLDVIL